MADYQRQINVPVTFGATTNATGYQWKINNIVVSTNKTFQKTFTTLGFHTVEFTGTNTCGDKCIQTIRIEIVPYSVETTTQQIVESSSQIIMGDYTTETTIVQTPIYKSKQGTAERIAEQSTSVLSRIENIEKMMLDSMIHRVNYNTHYYIDTSSTTRRKIDLLKDLGTHASELYVISEGGGFSLEINDEGYAVTPRIGFNITNETIEKIYVTGNGTSGTGRMRIGAWR